MSESDIGFIYLATNPSMPGLVKIGMTRGDVKKRIDDLGKDTGVPTPFDCPYFCEVQNPAQVERQLHEQFAFCRESGNREFFRTDWRNVRAALQNLLQNVEGGVISDSGKTKLTKIGKYTLIKWVKEENAENVRRVLAIGGKPDQADENRKTALRWATERKNTEIIKILLEADADPNKTIKDGYPALMYAARSGYAEGAELLLDAGAHPMYLGEAIDSGEPKVVELLLSAGADIHSGSLHKAVKLGYEKIVELLLSAGADPYEKYSALYDRKSRTALDIAQEEEHSEIVRILKEAGEKLFFAAVEAEDEEEVERLIDAGVDVNAEDGEGETALVLISLAENENVGIAEQLLDAGADVNAAGGDSYTALMNAAYSGNHKFVNLLLSKGANVHVKNGYGETALNVVEEKFTSKLHAQMIHGETVWSYADQERDYSEIVRILREAETEDSRPSTEQTVAPGLLLQEVGTTNPKKRKKSRTKSKASQEDIDVALRDACKKGILLEVNRLLVAGANPDSVDNDDQTALTYAASNGNVEIVKALLSAGANPNAEGRKGNMGLLMRAAVGEHTEVIKVLSAAGADPRIGAELGEGAFLYRAMVGREEFTRYLKDFVDGKEAKLTDSSARLSRNDEGEEDYAGWVVGCTVICVILFVIVANS